MALGVGLGFISITTQTERSGMGLSPRLTFLFYPAASMTDRNGKQLAVTVRAKQGD